jgi:hypothetical protein
LLTAVGALSRMDREGFKKWNVPHLSQEQPA